MTTIAYDETGTGPTVLLAHSTVCDRRMWDPQVKALAEAGYRAVRADFRGFGETPMPDQPYDNARDLRDVLDRAGAERAAVVAASGGGKAALELAARWPERVSALLLVATALAGLEPSDEMNAFDAREEELLEAGDVAGATELNVTTWLGPHADDATRAKVREMQRHAFDVQLAGESDVERIQADYEVGAVTARTLLLSGDHDLPDFRRIAVELAGRLPNARHVPLDWAGHLPSLERPDAFNALLLDFLRETGPGRV